MSSSDGAGGPRSGEPEPSGPLRGRVTISGGDAAPGAGGADRRRLGLSMLPLLAPGDELEWERPAAAPRIGDVVVFRDPEAGEGSSLVVHRVVGRLPSGALRTKGDGRSRADARPVPPADVLGVVVAAGGPDGWRSLRGGAARVYAVGAAAISRAGQLLSRAAAALDAALGPVLPAAADPDWHHTICARRAAWMAQRAAQLVWHAALGHACHPRVEEPADPV